MSYEAAEKQLSSINKCTIGEVPIKALSEWCATHAILVIPMGKRAGSTIKSDYVEAIWKFVLKPASCLGSWSKVKDNLYVKTI